LDIVIDIVIKIQGFRNVDKKFIPKEFAVVAINTTIFGYWIMMPSCPFSDLKEKTTGFHGIITTLSGSTAKPISHISRYNYAKLRQARYIYTREQEKAYLCELLSRNVYNLKGISPPFKGLPDGEEGGQRCIRDFELKQNFFARYATLTN